MSNLENILNKLGNEIVYLENEWEGVVIKSMPGEEANFFARTEGSQEYKIDYTSRIVNDALSIGKEITKEQYEKY